MQFLSYPRTFPVFYPAHIGFLTALNAYHILSPLRISNQSIHNKCWMKRIKTSVKTIFKLKTGKVRQVNIVNNSKLYIKYYNKCTQGQSSKRGQCNFDGTLKTIQKATKNIVVTTNEGNDKVLLNLSYVQNIVMAWHRFDFLNSFFIWCVFFFSVAGLCWLCGMHEDVKRLTNHELCKYTSHKPNSAQPKIEFLEIWHDLSPGHCCMLFVFITLTLSEARTITKTITTLFWLREDAVKQEPTG